ncbi:uroporphyrinogen-III synthase [Persephonella sp.]
MKILITREKSQAEKTAQLVKKEGMEPVVFPTIRFEPVEFDIKAVGNADILVFSSQNGVRFFFQKVNPETVKEKVIVATGEKTKKLLEKKGFKNVLVPDRFTGKDTAQLIKKLPEIKSKKVAVIRPVEGIDDLINILKNETQIKAVPVYRTATNIPDNTEKVRQLIEKGEIDYVLFTSPSTFYGFIEIFGKDWKKLLEKTKKAVIGTTTAKALQEKGIQPDIIPDRFTIEDLLSKIRQQAF